MRPRNEEEEQENELYHAVCRDFTPIYNAICDRSLGSKADMLFLGKKKKGEASSFTQKFSIAHECFIRATLQL